MAYFSIIMATRNNFPYLGLAIQSILNQTYSDWELIIVNDGSTDASHEILATYADRSDKITVIHNAHPIGVARARNLAVRASSGTWVVILDGDDSCLPTRLQAIYETTSRSPDLVICGTFSYMCDSDLQIHHVMEYPCSDLEIRKRILISSAFCLPSCALRRDAVLNVGGYNPSLQVAEDYDLSLRLLTLGKGCNLPVPLYLYRTHNNSLTSTMSTTMLLHTLYIKCKALIEYNYTFSISLLVIAVLQVCSLCIPTSIRRYIWNTVLFRLIKFIV